MGKVPALTDDGVVVTENPAICIHLADRYGYGTLAPRIEEPERGTYLRWMVFSTTVFEPGAYLPDAEDGAGVGWGRKADMLMALEAALTPGPYILGERFSAADVMLGGLVSIALFNKTLEERPPFAAYNARLADRPAYQRAIKLNGWG
jgi:glutathione S-transferase